MKTFEKLPTEENLIRALEENVLNRNEGLVYFYKLLRAKGTANSIAIDGRWGSGKSFFVRQSVLLINAMNPISKFDNQKRDKVINSLFKKQSNLHNINAEQNYDVAVYYDAWENDNDIDPVLSIVYEIAKQLALDYCVENNNIFKIAGSIIEALTGRNINGIINSLKSDDPLSKFKEEKKIHEMFKEFFTELLVERGERLILFIDELDRCKPSFAVNLLEQMKHYLSDDRIIFVFSVNSVELQHTIKNYYGYLFDAYRYLDRFFDVTISLPPANMNGFYRELGLDTSYQVEAVCRRFIEVYHLQLREIERYCRQIQIAIFEPTHDRNKWSLSFPDENGAYLILLYIVPIIVGLRIVNIGLHDEFINGKNPQPLLDMFIDDKIADKAFNMLLNSGETLCESDDNKRYIAKEQVIERLYNAIFVDRYTDSPYERVYGECEFNRNSKKFAISTANMLSDFANYEI